MSKRTGRTPGRRLLQSILAGEWAIRPEWLDQFAGIATRLGIESGATLSAEEIRGEIRRALASLNAGEADESLCAVSQDYGKPLGDGTRATVRDGVAVIRVLGPLFHYADEFHDVCGCTSYAQIAADIAAVRAARNTAGIRGTVFNFDTPGGEVGGCGETAGLIADLAREMPVLGYTPDVCASAGLWLASATGRLVGARASIVGSLGVVATYRRKGQSSGMIEIVSSQSPRKRPDAETEAGRAQIQSTVDALAQVMIEDVAGYRGRSVEYVLSHFGEGDLLVGETARAAGLLDAIGTFESVIQELSGSGSSRVGLRPAASAGGDHSPLAMEAEMPGEKNKAAENQEPQEITSEYLLANHSALVEAFRAEGRAGGEKDGAEKERARILGIQGRTLPGHEELAAKAIADGISPDAFAGLQIDAAKKVRAGGLAALAADDSALDVPPPSVTADGGGDASEGQTVQRILTAGKRITLPVPSQN